MKTEVVNMTPQKATDYLKRNNNNRPLKEPLVAQLMAFISNNQWKLTHQGVCISMTGNLIDGQHRLKAISKGNKSVPIMVTTGLPDDIMSVIDTGVKRTTGDVFSMLQVSNYNNIVASINKYLLIKNGTPTTGMGGRAYRNIGEILSNDQKYQLYLTNQTVIDKCSSLGQKCYGKAKLYSISEIAAMSMYLILDLGHSFSKVSNFWLQTHMVDGYDQTPATKALSGILVKYLSGSEKMKAKHKTAITIKAWNFYLNSAPIKQLRYTEDEIFPTLQ